MDYRFIGFFLGVILAVMGVLMMIPATADLIYGHKQNATAFFMVAIGGIFTGGLLTLTNINFKRQLGTRESFLMTTLAWVTASVLASLPLHFGDLQLSYIDCLFEGVSGITTTGSTILSGLDNMTPGTLLWRSLIQWIGGIGVIGLGIIFLPFLRVGGMQLFTTESSEKQKILPRTESIVLSVFYIYTALTLMCGLAYFNLGMSAFDALNHALTTLPTGGFSTHDLSLGYFESDAILWASSIFMLSGSIPFLLYIGLLGGKNRSLFRSREVIGLLKILAGFALVLALWLIVAMDTAVFPALTQSVFHTISVVTTTGYAAADYSLWGLFPLMLFLFMTYLGACSGSTAGGLKTMRLQIVMAQGWTQIRHLIYPRGQFPVTYEGRALERPVVQSVMVFLTLYVGCNAALAVLLALCGLDFLTALSGAATAIANVGPGIGEIIGPAGNFAALPDMAKLLLCLGMILGRLELMTVLVLFHPAFWRK